MGSNRIAKMAANDARSSSQKPSAPHGQRLAGKLAVISGGSKGIGYAVARTLAAEGCSVVISARDSSVLNSSAEQLRKESGNNADVVSIPCDVRNPESVEKLFAAVRNRFARVDILFNNAGISQPPTPLEQTSLELWRDQIDTNLTSVFLCCRAVLPLMKAGATIINNLSLAAKQIFPNFHAYTAAKTGALAFTLSLRAELMQCGIRVTALMPGATATELWQQIMPNAPLEHMLPPDSVAQAVLYAVLLPPEANLSELIVTPILGAV
jgi:NAD(P)-dependent dehydrogenase (short-subunit alcohol dehydrogenase family)